ncbi:MAG: hypothetical protein OEY52_05220 [Gammaproteobacteria bacterium]|nr:hypothetical protein [Gammaproteobacteria bacterium]
MNHSEETQVIYSWQDAMAKTISEKDLPQHMELVSKKVEVFGNPSNKQINYAGWYKRRKNEFENETVICISYANTKIKTITLRRIIFNVNESIVGADGRIITANMDVILELEDDDKWRLVEQNIRSWKHYKMNEVMASNG